MNFLVVGTDLAVDYKEEMWVPMRCFDRREHALKWSCAHNDQPFREKQRAIYLHVIQEPISFGCCRPACPVCHLDVARKEPLWLWTPEKLGAEFDRGVDEGLAHPRRPFTVDQFDEYINDHWRYPDRWPFLPLEEGARRI